VESRLSWPTLESLITESSEPPRWLIRDFLYQSSKVCLAGVPGVGKSLLSYTAAIAVASGLPFLGFETTQGKVLYLDEENGPASQPTYFRWAWRGLGSPPLAELSANLRIGQNAIISHNDTWLDLAVQEARSFRPNLIIFDTATKCFRIRDENDNAEATETMSRLTAIQAAADASTTLLILKHARIERDPRGNLPDRFRMRGASAWNGDADGVIFHLAPSGHYSGLRPTYLLPDKTRAFGLRTRLNITASWTSDIQTEAGIKLEAHPPAS
jgi:hypothetical protein